MKQPTTKALYPLDSSAIYHLGSMNKSYTNAYRFTMTLKEKLDPIILQNAVHNIAPRFSAIVAGIKKGFFNYYIAPVEKTPEVQRDSECLAHMPMEMLEDCAIRVLYDERDISMEFFHAITDGHGAMAFLKSVVAEYLSLKYSVQVPYSDDILNPQDTVKECEVADDYITYRSKSEASVKRRNAYRLPGRKSANTMVKTAGVYDAKEIINKAHTFGVSLTTLLTTVMVKALLEIQKEQLGENKKNKRPVRIMVPINLRNKFPSKTLRNFSLYALPSVEPEREDIEFEALIKDISKQINEQLSEEQLSAMMATNVNSQRMFLFRILPLPIKKLLLRIVFFFFGERSSCITLTNLGKIVLPEEMKAHVESVDVLLNPRKVVPHNCSVISYNGKLHINFTRRGAINALEKRFFEILDSIG